MSWKTTFTTYAQLSDPARLPLNVRVSHTERALSLFDKFPKAMYHLLVLPRVHESLTLKDLASLETVLNMDEGKAKGCLLMLKEESALAISMIEDEMVCVQCTLIPEARTYVFAISTGEDSWFQMEDMDRFPQCTINGPSPSPCDLF